MHIFMDESGDLGFGRGASKWFLFTLVVIDDPKKIEKITKKVWRTLRKKHKHIGELHAYKEKDVTKQRLLRMVAETDGIKIMALILNKDKVYIDFKNQKHYLYNYTANVLLEKLHTNEISSNEPIVHVVIDQKDTKKVLKDNFIKGLADNFRKAYKGDFKISLEASHTNKSLQVADFISWAIFQKYENGDYQFYEIFKDKIIDEFVFFP